MEQLDPALLANIGIGASFGLATLGAAVGMGVNGPAVIGSWKKCFVQNRPAPFILVAFAGSALSNVIYGFITMGQLMAKMSDGVPAFQIFALGLFAGLAIGAAAFTQSMCSASAADAYAETGKGFSNFLMVIGIGETIALFAMVFTIL